MKKIIKKSMSNSLLKQSGMTMLGMLVIIGFLLFQLVMAMNVIPVYMTDSTVAGIIEKLPDDPKVKGKSAKEIKKIIMARFRINSIYDLKDDIITIKRGSGVSVVTVEYEPRGELIGNLEFIVSFKHEASVPLR